MRNILISTLLTFILITSIAGCGPAKEEYEEIIIAEINDYDLTAKDFKSEIDLIMTTKYLSKDPLKAKEELLEELITKKLLLQKAQEENFDKNKVFMKEIERYWEQALLKLLLKKKTHELSREIVGTDKEARDEYNRMSKRFFAEVIILNDKAAAGRLSKSGADFDKVKSAVTAEIVSGTDPEWWMAGDLEIRLENALYSLKPGQISLPLRVEEYWAVIRVLNEETVDIEPYDKLAAVIKEDIRARKTQEAVENWIKTLRSQARIKINKNALQKIEIVRQ